MRLNEGKERDRKWDVTFRLQIEGFLNCDNIWVSIWQRERNINKFRPERAHHDPVQKVRGGNKGIATYLLTYTHQGMRRVRKRTLFGRQAASEHFLSYTTTNGFGVAYVLRKIGGWEGSRHKGGRRQGRSQSCDSFQRVKKKQLAENESNVSLSYYL